MLDMLHGMGLALSTIERKDLSAEQISDIQLVCNSPSLTRSLKGHIMNGPTSLGDLTSTNDRLMVKRVLANVRKLTRRGFRVTLTAASGED